MTTNNTTEIDQIITMNRQSGETYALKMKKSSSMLVGIPIPSNSDPEKFAINIKTIKGTSIVERYIADIETIEKQ